MWNYDYFTSPLSSNKIASSFLSASLAGLPASCFCEWVIHMLFFNEYSILTNNWFAQVFISEPVIIVFMFLACFVFYQLFESIGVTDCKFEAVSFDNWKITGYWKSSMNT